MGYFSHFSEINVKLAEKKRICHSFCQKTLRNVRKQEKPSVFENFRQKKFYQWRTGSPREKFCFRFKILERELLKVPDRNFNLEIVLF